MDIKDLYSDSDLFKKILTVIEHINKNGGHAFLVGGVVRDFLLGIKSTDFDLEVYGLEPQELNSIIETLGKVAEVGKSFGIYKLDLGNGVCLDISIPRTDSKIDYGHQGFRVNTNPNMSYADAVSRRDFTINSILLDPLTNEIIDPSRGQVDLENRVLRITNHQKFGDDPLRILRAMQFIGRFDLKIIKEDISVYKSMIPCLVELPKERIGEEWFKLLSKSKKPSIGLDFAMEVGIINKLYPKFFCLKETEQDAKWHPEGNVWVHTMMVIDNMAEICDERNIVGKRKIALMLSALCHDLGKVETTIYKDGRIKSPGHDKYGEEPTRDFLNAIGVDNETKSNVINLVLNHMAPILLYKQELKQKVSDHAIRKLALRIFPACIEDLILLNKADHLGRGYANHDEMALQAMDVANWLEGRAKKLEIVNERPKNFIEGKEFIALGYKEGKNIGEFVELANELHFEKGLSREDIIETILRDFQASLK